jgi:hypothetical protein
MKPKLPLTVIGALLLISAAILIWPNVSAFFASDGCLDSGGSYDYVASRCDYVQNHPFVPFYRTWSFWLATIAAVMGSLAFARSADGRAA